MMKTRRELDMAAEEFAGRHGMTVHDPEDVYDGLALYGYSWLGMVEGGCYGPPAYILVDVETDEARCEANTDIDKCISDEVRRNLKPMPED